MAGFSDAKYLELDLLRSMRRAGHPAYAHPDSAISPEGRRVCSHSKLLSSIEAPDRSRDPFRIAHLNKRDQYYVQGSAKGNSYPSPSFKLFREKLPRELMWATTEELSRLTSFPRVTRSGSV